LIFLAGCVIAKELELLVFLTLTSSLILALLVLGSEDVGRIFFFGRECFRFLFSFIEFPFPSSAFFVLIFSILDMFPLLLLMLDGGVAVASEFSFAFFDVVLAVLGLLGNKLSNIMIYDFLTKDN